MKVFVILSVFVWCLIHDIRPQNLPDLTTEEWNSFKSQYSKTYKSATEETLRMQTYINNKKLITRHNEKFRKGEVSFELGMNQFGDWLHSEYILRTSNNKLNVENGNANEPKTSYFNLKENRTVLSQGSSQIILPPSLDYRKQGIVSEVKEEGNCHASWAFSATGVMESGYARSTGKLIPLSEQHLIDCASPDGDCEDGDTTTALMYCTFLAAINTEKSYPYEGAKNECRYKPENSAGYSITNLTWSWGQNEDVLKSDLVNYGPISVHIDASHESFQFYKSGVYYEEKCNPGKPTRWALVVGYGSDNGNDYWLVKNSLGTSWGEQGYVRIARNKNSHCGISLKYTYPQAFIPFPPTN